MGRSNAEATIYTERDGDVFAPGTSLARDHPDAAITPRPPIAATTQPVTIGDSFSTILARRLGTESSRDSPLERNGFEIRAPGF